MLYILFYFQPTGFTMEVTNTNNTTVPMGIRVLLGSQSAERAPSYIEVFRRSIQIQVFAFYILNFASSFAFVLEILL